MYHNILFISANPNDTKRLRVGREYRDIEAALERAEHHHAFRLNQHPAATPDSIQRALDKYKPTIVHFSGHGEGEAGLIFEDEHGYAQQVSTQALAALFKLFVGHIHCVVLNACYADVQAEVIATYVPYVIGMSDNISDQAALKFSVAFYDALGAGKEIEYAFQAACVQLQLLNLPEDQVPVLKKGAIEPPLTPKTHPIEHDSSLDIKRCIHHLTRRYQQDSDTFTPLFLRAEAGNLPSINVIPATLLWSHRGPIEDMPDGQLDVAEETEGKVTALTEVVDKHPILVLRGDPGTGKTTSCRFLVHRLAQAFSTTQQSDEIKPLPVFVELNRFRVEPDEEAEDALARLLTLALRENNALTPDYQPSVSDGRRWLAQAEQTLPLALFFDGLNEVPPAFKEAAEHALKQLAEHLRGTSSRMVITTRRYGFETWRLNLKVYDLQPLKPTAIKAYIQRQLDWDTEKVETLYEKQLGARLRLQASNPLLLNLLCDVLRQQTEQTPVSRGELFQIFVQGVLERWENKVKDSDYGQRNFTPQQKQQALERLAFHMQTSGRVISVEQSQALFAEVLNISLQQADALLEEICVNHLLVKRSDTIEFAHHTLQEYFCASALYHRWKEQPTPGQIEWTPNFQQALDDPHWWEPLAMAGGLFYRNELEDLVKQIEDKPILTGMLLGNARPETPAEHHFLHHATEKVQSGIWRSIALTQSVLVAMTAVCVAVAIGAWWLMNTQGGLGFWLSLLGVNRLDGLSSFWGGMGLSIGGLVLGTFLSLRTTEFIRAQHDNLLDSCYARWIEPWLLALFYIHSERAEHRLEKLLNEYGNRRFVDESLRARLVAFSTRALNQDVDSLLAQLGEADKQTTAVAILALEFDAHLAHSLLQNLSSQSVMRQQAEIMLYQTWVQRHEAARISRQGESFLQSLEAYVKDRTYDYVLRCRLAKALNQTGETKVKTEWNFDWIGRLGHTLKKSLLNILSFIENSILTVFTIIPFYVLLIIMAFPFLFFKKGETNLYPVLVILFYSPISLVFLPIFIINVVVTYGIYFLRPHNSIVLKTKIEIDSLFSISNLLIRAGKLEKAEKYIRQALEVEPKKTKHWISLIDLLIRAKRENEAEKLLQQALEKFPDNEDILFSQGNFLHFNHENYPEAIKAYRTALKLQPDAAYLIRSLCLSLRLNGDLAEAEQTARRAMEIAPNEVSSWEQLINVLIDSKQPTEAEKLLQQALKKFPNNVHILFSQGNLFNFSHDNYPEAIKAYRTALKLQPDAACLIRSLCLSLRLNGDLAEAEQTARRAMEIAPNEVSSWRRLISVLMDKGQNEEANKLLNQSLQRFPKNDVLWWLKCEYLLLLGALGDYPTAWETYEKARQLAGNASPLDAEEWDLFKAEIQLHLGQNEQALLCLEAIEQPINSAWQTFLLSIANPQRLPELTPNPLLACLQLWLQDTQTADLSTTLEALPPLPETGFSRQARQAALYLQAQLYRTINSSQSETLMQQAQALSQADLQRLKALLALFPRKEEQA